LGAPGGLTRFLLVWVLSCRWVGLVYRDGVALGILAEGKPCDTGDRYLGHERLSAVLFDEIGVDIDGWNFDSYADGLSGVLASSESAVDAGGGAVPCDHVPMRLATLRRVVFPACFKVPSEDFLVEVDCSLGNICRDGKIADFWHGEILVELI
jgi:hypothetical protein